MAEFTKITNICTRVRVGGGEKIKIPVGVLIIISGMVEVNRKIYVSGEELEIEKVVSGQALTDSQIFLVSSEL